MFCLICAWINGGINKREPGDLRHQHAQYDVIVMALGFMVALCAVYVIDRTALLYQK